LFRCTLASFEFALFWYFIRLGSTCFWPGIQFRTADKQKPSPLQLAREFSEVLSVRSSRSVQKPGTIRQQLDEAVSDYNATTKNRNYKITAEGKRLILNLLK
jgi:hypothetical protein